MKGLLLSMFTVVLTCAAQAQQLNADAGPDVTICSNGQATLNGSASGGQAPYEYSWSPATGLSDPNIANPVCTVNSNTTFTLTVTGNDGNTATDQVTVTVNQAPSPGITAASPVLSTEFNNLTTFYVCGTSSFTFNLSNASTGAPNNAIYAVNWGNGNTTNPPDGNWSSSQTYPLGLTQGSYTITNPNGCSSTLNFNVFVGDVPLGGAVPSTGTTICTGQSITLLWNNFANNPPGTNYIVNWGDGSSDTVPHPPPATISHTYTTSSCSQPDGEYTASWEISNPCDTRTGIFNQIRVSEAPQASFTQLADTVCINTTVTFTDASTGSQAPQCATPNHVWTISPGTYTVASGSLGSINGSPNTPGLWTSGSDVLGVQFTAPGIYTITDVVGNAICGLDTLVRTIIAEAPPTPQITQNGTSLASTNGQSYQWLLNGQPIPGASGPTWVPLVPGTYTVAVTDNNGCTGTSAPFDVLSVGLEEGGRAGSLVTWPVPCSDLLNVATPAALGDQAALELFDAQGRLVLRVRPHGGTTVLDLRDRPAGIHHLRLVDGHTQWTATIHVL